MTGPPAAPPAGHGPGYETRDVSIRPILYTAGVLVLAAGMIHVGLWLLFELFAARGTERAAADRPLGAALERSLPPEPRLQHAPREDLDALRAWESRMLTTYAVVDRATGVVRIPIERALELIAERGLPARKDSAAEPHASAELQPPNEPEAAAPSEVVPAPEDAQ